MLNLKSSMRYAFCERKSAGDDRVRESRSVRDGRAEGEGGADTAARERDVGSAEAPARGRRAGGRRRGAGARGVERRVHVRGHGRGPLVRVARLVPVERDDDRRASARVAVDAGPAAAPAARGAVDAGDAEGRQERTDVELAEAVLALEAELAGDGRE